MESARYVEEEGAREVRAVTGAGAAVGAGSNLVSVSVASGGPAVRGGGCTPEVKGVPRVIRLVPLDRPRAFAGPSRIWQNGRRLWLACQITCQKRIHSRPQHQRHWDHPVRGPASQLAGSFRCIRSFKLLDYSSGVLVICAASAGVRWTIINPSISIFIIGVVRFLGRLGVDVEGRRGA